MSIPPPPSRAEILDFPVHVLTPAHNVAIYRITKPQDAAGNPRDVLYFGGSGLGRFDLLGGREDDPKAVGICYLGTTAIACFLEKFGDLRVIPPSEVAANVLATIHVAREVKLADMCHGRVLGGFGLTAEIWTSGTYLRPQEWARALHQAGFGGIVYGTRHDPAGQLRAVAVFGSRSANPLVVDSVNGVPEALIQEAFAGYGLVVGEPPPWPGSARG